MQTFSLDTRPVSRLSYKFRPA